MLRRALFLVTNENEIGALATFAKTLAQKYDVETHALYVEDVLKYEVYPATISGVGLNVELNYSYQEYINIESKNYKIIKDKIEKDFTKVYSRDGETVEIALEELKKYDFLVVVKNDKVSSNLKELLRSSYKPLIILPLNIDEAKMDKLVLLDDGAYNANKTLFTYFNIFGEQKIDVLKVNVDEEDFLKERFGNNYNVIKKEGVPFKIIMEETKKYDMVLMGDLRYTVMVERITRKLGVRLLENLEKIIFIV